MLDDYAAFLERKTHLGGDHGFEPEWMPDALFGFQSALVEWAVRKGRGAMFAGTGLGKTVMQLVWAENVVRKTGGRVLVLAPLMVVEQTVREAARFGIDAQRSADGTLPQSRIVVANYERLHRFDPADFAGVVCDESSCLKDAKAVTRAAVTAFARKLPYRLLATATPAPNDHVELGTSSEALGYLGFMEMLERFFKNDQGNSETQRVYGKGAKWRFKGHAEGPFWQWLASWSRAVRRPSDLGFPDDGFALPPLTYREHVVTERTAPPGMLFAVPAVGPFEIRQQRRRTIAERCDRVTELVANTGEPAIVWCQQNAEGDALERSIPGAVQVSGRDDDDAKTEKLAAFLDGETRVLVTKPVIGAWGLNLQHCAHVVIFPDYSFEQHYQAVRRCWRFGQTRPVTVDVVATDGEAGVRAILERKQQQYDRMFEELVAHMADAVGIDRRGAAGTAVALPPGMDDPRGSEKRWAA